MNMSYIKKYTQRHTLVGCHIHFFPVLPSTNVLAKQWVSCGMPEGTTIISDFQTQGRGQSGRTWEAQEETSILLTVILYPVTPVIDTQSMVDLGVEAVFECLMGCLPGVAIRVKAPNDIYVGDKKLAGVLVESVSQGDDLEYVTLGIGINVNNQTFSSAISSRATSLRCLTGQCFIRETIIIRLLRLLDCHYDDSFHAF